MKPKICLFLALGVSAWSVCSCVKSEAASASAWHQPLSRSLDLQKLQPQFEQEESDNGVSYAYLYEDYDYYQEEQGFWDRKQEKPSFSKSSLDKYEDLDFGVSLLEQWFSNRQA